MVKGAGGRRARGETDVAGVGEVYGKEAEVKKAGRYMQLGVAGRN